MNLKHSSNSISNLSKKNQRTVNRLWEQKTVSVGQITGLFNIIENKFHRKNPDFEPSNDWSKPTTHLRERRHHRLR